MALVEGLWPVFPTMDIAAIGRRSLEDQARWSMITYASLANLTGIG